MIMEQKKTHAVLPCHDVYHARWVKMTKIKANVAQQFFHFHVRFKSSEIATNGMVGAELWVKRLRHLFYM